MRGIYPLRKRWGTIFEHVRDVLDKTDPFLYTGRVSRITGLAVESAGPQANIGDLCRIDLGKERSSILAEVVGFREDKVLLMPYGSLSGIGPGCTVTSTNQGLVVGVGPAMQGRILDGLGSPMDGLGAFPITAFYPVERVPENPLSRARITQPMSLGIRSIDGLLTCGRGQRMGIFAGSGVGKSTLLGMIARSSSADVNVIVLVGERGREVREFIEKELQEDGLSRTVLIVATSEQPALIRLKSALIGTTIAEYFRDQGKHVLLLMDSLTRFAMAQREIGLAMGEPPVSRGYTPSVLALLPKLLERAGTAKIGSITGLYTVLVDGDDLNEPITDMARGILDGHIVLSRSLANRNHYPAIDILASVSRVMPDIVAGAHKASANEIRRMMAIYKDLEDLIQIGAYRKGNDADMDRAVELIKPIHGLLRQTTGEYTELNMTIKMMQRIVQQGEPK